MEYRGEKVLFCGGGACICIAAIVLGCVLSGDSFVPTEPKTQEPMGTEDTNQNESSKLPPVYSLYFAFAQKHVLISGLSSEYRKACKLEHVSQVELIKELKDSIVDVYQEVGGARNDHQTDKWFAGKNAEVNKLRATLAREERVEQCMVKRQHDLQLLTDKEKINMYSVRDNFKWREMLTENGMCLDPTECFCDVLLKPNDKFDAFLAENQLAINKANAAERSEEL